MLNRIKGILNKKMESSENANFSDSMPEESDELKTYIYDKIVNTLDVKESNFFDHKDIYHLEGLI